MTDTPEICAARALDPKWHEEMERLRDAATERFAKRRAEIGLPLVRKMPGERF